jgi:hypothetical protein
MTWDAQTARVLFAIFVLLVLVFFQAIQAAYRRGRRDEQYRHCPTLRPDEPVRQRL